MCIGLFLMRNMKYIVDFFVYDLMNVIIIIYILLEFNCYFFVLNFRFLVMDFRFCV